MNIAAEILNPTKIHEIHEAGIRRLDRVAVVDRDGVIETGVIVAAVDRNGKNVGFDNYQGFVSMALVLQYDDGARQTFNLADVVSISKVER